MARYATAITKIRYGALKGRYTLCGSVPYELSKPVTRPHTPQNPPLREAFKWGSEAEAIEALLTAGVAKFQKADCSWYGG